MTSWKIKDKLLIEVIITNSCNKRCPYCDLDFMEKSIGEEMLDALSHEISRKKKEIDFHLNFFGGEPLICFDKIRYITERNPDILYSIGTNGLLLDEEKLGFFKDNDFDIYLSVDNISIGKGLDLEMIKSFEGKLQINFINDPMFIDDSIKTYELIKGFRNINIMPVFSTRSWDKVSLMKLKVLLDHVKKDEREEKARFFRYFNGFSPEKQFILDTDGFFYEDLDSLLWLQKQYKVVDSDLRHEIHEKTKICSVSDISFSEKLVSSYNPEKILKNIFEIPKRQDKLLEYKLIDKISEDA